MAAVAASLQALRERRHTAAAGRQRLVARQSAARCAVTPLLGRDALAAAAVLQPVAHVHVIAQQVGAAVRLCCMPVVPAHVHGSFEMVACMTVLCACQIPG